MITLQRNSSLFLSVILSTVVTTVTLNYPLALNAQELTLEEVVVTAQRRVESLQEVPISIEVFDGAEIELQGFRNMEDISKFSPSITINDDGSIGEAYIRGFGTDSNSLTFTTATPIFSDGIHYGRPTMIKNAFMDAQQVEVLLGPQPLHFGMNATAGAFNVTSRRPTPEWEGDINFEMGRYGNREISGAIGGPLTDTLGIRFAGISENSDGPMEHFVTKENGPRSSNLGGRIVLQWTPIEQFQALTKFEYTDLHHSEELIVGCLTPGTIFGNRGDAPTDGRNRPPTNGDTQSIYAPPPKGLGDRYRSNINLPEAGLGEGCYKDSNFGLLRGGQAVLEPPGPFSGIFQQESRDDGGLLDIRDAAEGFTTQQDPSGPGTGGIDIGGILASDDVESWSAVLDMTYELASGISINSQTGWVHYETIDSRDNNDSPFFEDLSSRTENYYQISQQIRVETPAGGYEISPDIFVEAMGGVFHQEADLDLYSSSLRANVRRGQRFNNVWEDSRWTAAFWNLTFHMMDRQVSVSAGGRYTDIHKDVFLQGFGAQWIYDELPCDSDEMDPDPASCNIDPDFKRVDPSLTTYTTLDPITGNDSDPDEGDVRIDSPRILVDGADLNNLWTVNSWNDTRDAPRNWRGGGADAVGLTAPVYSVREGPFGPCDFCIEDVNQDVDNYDHQFVIRYTPDRFDGDHSFYAKYATAFKGPVTDSGRTGLPADLDELIFEPEFTKAYEIGAKGNYWDNRARYSVAGFINKFRDLQTSSSAPLSVEAQGVQSVIALNAGGQEVKGIEFSTRAVVMEGLTVDFAGMLMEGEMIEFDGGGCSAHEIIAASADAVNNPSGRSADELDLANEILDDIGLQRRTHALNSTIPEEYLRNGGCRLEDVDLPGGGVGEAETHDLSGISAAFTPNWKFVLGVNYTRPFTDNLEYFINAKGLVSDGYKTGLVSYVTVWPTHADLNLSAGIGDQDGTWRLMGYARNIFEATQIYREEFDFEQDGLGIDLLKDSSFMSYGIKFEYHYR